MNTLKLGNSGSTVLFFADSIIRICSFSFEKFLIFFQFQFISFSPLLHLASLVGLSSAYRWWNHSRGIVESFLRFLSFFLFVCLFVCLFICLCMCVCLFLSKKWKEWQTEENGPSLSIRCQNKRNKKLLKPKTFLKLLSAQCKYDEN